MRESWRKLWADIQRARDDADGRFLHTRRKGALTLEEPTRSHEFDMAAGKTYVIDLVCSGFDGSLGIENAGMKLASGQAGVKSRVVFTVPNNGVFQLVVAADGAGFGNYQLVVRQPVDDEAKPADQPR